MQYLRSIDNYGSVYLKTQSGAAVLLLLLLILVSASSLLLSKLDAGVRYSVYSPQSSVALKEAKEALTSWAVNHPINPGTLPFPDRKEVVSPNYDGDSDCTTGAVGNNLLLGKIPWRDYPAPACKDAGILTGLSLYVTDKSGEQLWYAVSKNLVYESPDYPFISPGLLNKSTDWITVRDQNGGVISDRVAFILLAPGPSLPGYTDCEGLSYTPQDRTGAVPDIENYLDNITIGATTYSNADYDQDFIIYPNSDVTSGNNIQERCDQFNDQVLFVTIDELIDEVSRRALNEATYALSAYHQVNGALPWLVPFADPKSEPRRLTGQATSASSNLVDSSVDFTNWGVVPGDIVWNITDGSRGEVTAVSANTLTIGGGLTLGSNNSFSIDDEYYVETSEISTTLRGGATSNSTVQILENTLHDFDDLGIKVGDIILNTTDASQGIISLVDDDELTTTLSGGTDNDFDIGDSYRIKNNAGRATVDIDTNGLTLEDSVNNFVTMGVQTGDLVRNITDGSYGRVSGIVSPNRLIFTSLRSGANNIFSVNDYYVIQRFIPGVPTRNGMLPFYLTGEPFTADFNLEWGITSGATIATNPEVGGTSLHATYTGAMSTYISNSNSYPASISVADNQSACIWISQTIAECRGSFTADMTSLFNGTITSIPATDTIADVGEDFPSKGVKRGDKITNLTDLTEGIIRTTYSTNIDRLRISDITGQTGFSQTVGNSYKLDISTATITGTASFPTVDLVYRMYDAGADFSDVEVGDIIENLLWTAIGQITAVNAGASPPYVDFTPLTDGDWPDFVVDEQYRIHHNFVASREYEFDIRFSGNAGDYAVLEQRKRDVCVGYGADCSATPSVTALSGDGATNTVTIIDYDSAAQKLATTSITLPITGALGSMKLSGLNYYLDVDRGDLPEWFVRNKWYQYVLVAYSNGESPAITTCVAGTDCLTLNIRDNTNTVISSRNDVRALVMLAKDALTTQSWANATINDYFDNASNIDLTDDIFDKHPESNTFNDLFRIATSCPTDTAELCWSN